MSKTGIRLENQVLEPTLELGNSTQEAVFNGGVASLVALAQKEIEEQKKERFQTKRLHYWRRCESFRMICWLIRCRKSRI